MNKMEAKGNNLTKWVINISFIVISLVALFPLISLIISSFRPSTELMRDGISFSVNWDTISLDNYMYIFTQAGEYWKWYGNSLIVTGLTIFLSLFFSSMVGYALALYSFRGKNIIFLLVYVIILIPFEILMLPLYQLMIDLQLTDTYIGIMLPLIIAPIAVFFFRQYAMGLPKELMDAARIDGCTEYGIFFRIMMPLMLPSFAAMAILQGLTSWNNFLWPLLVVRSSDMFTLPIGLATLCTPYGNNYDILLAVSVMTVIPVVILFIFFQRYFVAGLTTGGVKG